MIWLMRVLLLRRHQAFLVHFSTVMANEAKTSRLDDLANAITLRDATLSFSTIQLEIKIPMLAVTALSHYPNQRIFGMNNESTGVQSANRRELTRPIRSDRSGF
jgi:hypothetical protein